MYGLRYTLPFLDIDGLRNVVNFYKRDYSGGVEVLQGVAGQEVIIQKNLGGNGDIEWINTTEVAISFYPSESVNLTSFRSMSNRDWRVEIIENGEILYVLWLVNSDARQPMAIRNRPVSLKATDGLGLLKNKKIDIQRTEIVWVNTETLEEKTQVSQPHGDNWVSDEVTMSLDYFEKQGVVNLLFLCFQKTGFDLGVRVVWNVVSDYMVAGEDSPLSLIVISLDAFKGKSVYDTLLMLCQTFGFYIEQFRGQWRVIRINELASRKHIGVDYTFTENGTYQVSSEHEQTVKIGSILRDYPDVYYVNDDHDTFFFEPYKSLSVKCVFGQGRNLIDGDFKNVGNLIQRGWSVFLLNPTFIVNRESQKYGFELSGSTPEGYMRLPRIQALKGQGIKFSFDFKRFGGNNNTTLFKVSLFIANAIETTGYIFKDSETDSLAIAGDWEFTTTFDKWVKRGKANMPSTFLDNDWSWKRFELTTPVWTGSDYSIQIEIGNVNNTPSGTVAYANFEAKVYSSGSQPKSQKTTINTIAECDYSPSDFDIQFVDDARSDLVTSIGGVYSWCRPNRIETLTFDEVLATSLYNLRMHDNPNIEGSFMYKGRLMTCDTFWNDAFDPRYLFWSGEINLRNKEIRGVFVPICDTDISRNVEYSYNDVNDNENVTLRKLITITEVETGNDLDIDTNGSEYEFGSDLNDLP